MTSNYIAVANYLQALDRSLSIGWKEFYRQRSGSIYESLALLHPWHYDEIDLPEHLTQSSIQVNIQGNRNFKAGKIGSHCHSSLLWGYECELDVVLQMDHLFPYSLGGPTISGNMLTLCKYHNMVKSSDIHCYPWGQFDKWAIPWVVTQVEKIKNQVIDLYG